MLETVIEIFKKILHLDVLINDMALVMGPWMYLILFLVIFCETGLVVTPFLPGDSLLFAVGALSAASPHFDIKIFIPLLIAASILGDSTNYFIGRNFGRKAFEREHRFSRFFNKKYLRQTEEFYEKRGVLAVFLARFAPIVRTFAPFVAGITKMRYNRFLTYSILGSITWVGIFTLAGYFFGQIPFIQKNFTLLVLGIIGFSLAPLLFAAIRNYKEKRL